MTSILSTISGYFSKSLILGTFLPAVLFVILSLTFLFPLLPSDLALLKPIEALEPQWKIVVTTLVIIVLSGMMYNLNIPIIRIYEGYPWRASRIGQRRTRYYKTLFDNALVKRQGLRTLLNAMRTASDVSYASPIESPPSTILIEEAITNLRKMGAFPQWLNRQDRDITALWGEIFESVQSAYSELYQKIANNFPSSRDLILPTSLGNVIRSFEDYSEREYKIDSIVMWPRLIAKIDKEYATSIDDGKTAFDFMINASALSATLASSILLAGLLSTSPLSSISSLIYWLVEILAFATLSYWLYLLSIPRAAAWGSMVKGAFDLYRGDILKQLGYKRPLTTIEDERDLWDKISLQMIYGDPPKLPPVDDGDAREPPLRDHGSKLYPPDLPTFVRGNPSDIVFEITRGIDTMQSPPVGADFTIKLGVRNIDGRKRRADKVIVTDTLPDGYQYEFDSAGAQARNLHSLLLCDRNVQVQGANPYQFTVTDLGPDELLIVTYRVVRCPTES